MSELREAAQAVEDELRNQHKAFANWFLELHATTTLDPEDLAWAAWKAALAQPETAEPVAWRTFNGEGGYDYREFDEDENYDEEWRRLNPAHPDWVEPLYAHPPRDEWRPASEPPEDGRDVVVWMNDGGHGCFAIGHCLRGAWTPNYVGSPVTHWRDVQPPTEGTK